MRSSKKYFSLTSKKWVIQQLKYEELTTPDKTTEAKKYTPNYDRLTTVDDLVHFPNRMENKPTKSGFLVFFLTSIFN